MKCARGTGKQYPIRVCYVKNTRANIFSSSKPLILMSGAFLLMLRLTSTYYAFGCEKYICKKCHLRNLYGCTAETCVVCKKIFL